MDEQIWDKIMADEELKAQMADSADAISEIIRLFGLSSAAAAEAIVEAGELAAQAWPFRSDEGLEFWLAFRERVAADQRAMFLRWLFADDSATDVAQM